MKKVLLSALLSALTIGSFAQQTRQIAPPQMQPTPDDPVIMTIEGTPVLRSEFEYSYNKNNNQAVIDKKSVEEYVPLFVNYKLKVREALNQHIDTTASFIDEFLSYRDQQVKPTFVTDADIEAKAKQIYADAKNSAEASGGLFNCAHIFFRIPQKLDMQEINAQKAKVDSVYQLLKSGNKTFEELVAEYSEDPHTREKGGELGWVQKGTLFTEFETPALALKDGEVSEVVQSPAGYHIIKMIGHRNFFDYDSVRTNILQFIEARNLRNVIADEIIAAEAGKDENATPETVLDNKALEMQTNDSETRNLIREYYEGLLLYDVSNQEVWDKAIKDEKGQEAFFLKNRKNYKYDTPVYKGMVYHVKDKATEKAVKKTVKNLPFEQWSETLRSTFNNDTVIRIRVELGRFKPGDNKWVDNKAFKKDVKPTKNEKYPIEGLFGKTLKEPENYLDVKNQVQADYQEFLEQQWVEQLRKKYKVNINEDVIRTVNNH